MEEVELGGINGVHNVSEETQARRQPKVGTKFCQVVGRGNVVAAREVDSLTEPVHLLEVIT